MSAELGSHDIEAFLTDDERPSVSFESLTFSDGTTITLDSTDIVVFVGPNNAGKSLALRELETHIGPTAKLRVIQSVELHRKGTTDQLRKVLEQHGRKSRGSSTFRYRGFRYDLTDENLDVYWKSRLDRLRPLFCLRVATESRITDSNPQSAIAILDQPPSHPIQILYIDDQAEHRISSYFRRAFGQDLILFHAGGGQWPLLVGDRLAPEEGEDRVSLSYNRRLLATTVPLQTQGDGMRSFASVVLHLLVPETQTVLLLDEPEAFLYPPQARLLGEFIARERAKNTQLFIATHSSDVLQGLLNVAPDHLRIIRIQREGTVNRVKELDKSRTKAISLDPLMKFSSVMSGVFHQRVVICESDSDCMFYSSILDVPQVRGEQQPDVLFVHASGKDRMAVLAESLRALDVTIDVIVDMDVLNDLEALKRIVSALGGDWPTIAAQATPLKKAIEEHKPWLSSNDIAKGIRDVLEAAPSAGEFPKELRIRIESLFKRASPWDAVKDAGKAAIPAGQATQHYENLQNLCKCIRLWIVPVGELEGFCKSIGGHGPRWVQQVIEQRDLASDADLAGAREFLRELWNYRELVPEVAK